MKLQVNPLVDAHCRYALNISRSRAERQTLQGMHSPLGVVHLRGIRGFLLFFLGSECRESNEREQQ
jgi:hypothetical protein